MNWVICFIKEQHDKVLYIYAIKVPMAARNFFPEFWFGPRLGSTSLLIDSR